MTPGTMAPVNPAARVVVLAGPSGAGKTRLARLSGLPVLALDNFYKDGDDPTLPRFPSGEVDWDSRGTWHAEQALAAVQHLCRTGEVDVPVYDLPGNRRTGHVRLALSGARHLVAEGIFAADLVAACRKEGLLAAAICVRRSRWITFWLRLRRDLREHRKPVPVLLRRGWRLLRAEPRIVAALVAKGCVPMSPQRAARCLERLEAERREPEPG